MSTFKEELEPILKQYRAIGHTTDVTIERITQLIEKRVIGLDDFKNDLVNWETIRATYRNQLRADQRKEVRGE